MKDRIKKAGFLVLMLALVGFVFFRAGVKVGAADSEPGGVGDPLVSKSYLDSRLNDLSGVMTKVTISQGSVLTAAEGATIIVFSGNGIVSGSGAGLINVTAGELTATGNSMAKYNTYLFPDAATSVTAGSTMVVFVTGTYQITQ